MSEPSTGGDMMGMLHGKQADAQEVMTGLQSHFDSSLSKATYPGSTSTSLSRSRSGHSSGTLGLWGYKLYFLTEEDAKQPMLVNSAGERVEEVFQIGLELHQCELLGMNFEMLQQIGVR
ncbi:hypothetical protein BJY01DRAFT_243361 [Aspergillus pseudoustus]|uniref:Uncharacterized protein n=1 Tax=Aspergillus pseudoustus TaxID=1810923 RepID=A0ABR4KSX7_9EURO